MKFFCLLHKAPSWCRSAKGYCPSEEAAAQPPQTALLHQLCPWWHGPVQRGTGFSGREREQTARGAAMGDQSKWPAFLGIQEKKWRAAKEQFQAKLLSHSCKDTSPQESWARKNVLFFFLFQQVLANICQQEGIFPDNTTAWIHTEWNPSWVVSLCSRFF